jgi:hypothetical protein
MDQLIKKTSDQPVDMDQRKILVFIFPRCYYIMAIVAEGVNM